MSGFVELFVFIFCVVLYRVSINKFCEFVEFRKKLVCVVGMILAYTGILMEIIYLFGNVLGEMFTVRDFSIYAMIIIFTMNLIVGAMTIVMCSTGRKRMLSDREKIMLKDL